MSETITVDNLWNGIHELLIKNKKIIKDLYPHTKKYTNYIINQLEALGESKSMGYHVNKEYWPRVDVSFFNRETENNWQEWSREVAIEHENDAGSWDEELDKLFAINAGIKVLMTYSDKSNSELLQDLNNNGPGTLLSIYKSRKYHTENDKYLLVFGPVIGSNRKSFSAFIFDGKKVEQLPGSVEI